jgi:hypothetical protein
MKNIMKQLGLVRNTAIVAVCILSLAALGSTKNPVTRPMRVQGNVTVTINLSDGTWVVQDLGEATHTGRYVNHGSGHFDAQGNPVGSGTGTAANGDQIFWGMPGSSWNTQFTGGTGRFQNLTGGFNVVFQSTPVVTFPDPNTMVETYTYIGEGTVTY